MCWKNPCSGWANNEDRARMEIPLIPTYVRGISTGVHTVSTKYFHVCALTYNGETQCWGWNDDGQVGDGIGLHRKEPVRVSGVDSNVISIATGLGHTCVVTFDGKVKCWGGHINGGLGDGTGRPSYTPVDVLQGEDRVVSIEASSSNTCYITDLGTVKCWGETTIGNLGYYHKIVSTQPETVDGLENVIRITVGSHHACAMLVDDSIWCWGSNQYGELGRPFADLTHSNQPVEVEWK